MANDFKKRGLMYALLLVGFAVRLWGLRGIDLGLDGGLSLGLSYLSFPDAVHFLARDVHPPLYYLLLRPWVGLVGSSPFAVKYLNGIIATLTLAAVAGWVRSLSNWRAATIATAIFVVEPAAIQASATVRDFTLALLFIVLACWAYTRWSAGSRLWFVVAGALALWTSYQAVPVFAVAAVHALRQPTWKAWWLAIAAIGASILPWIVIAIPDGILRTLQSSGPRQKPTPPEPLLVQLRDLARLLSGGLFLDPIWLGPALLGIAILGLLAWLLMRTTREKSKLSETDWLLVAAGMAGIAFSIIVNTFWTRQGLPGRYILPYLPFLVAVYAKYAARASRGWAIWLVGPILLAGAMGVSGWYGRPPTPSFFFDPTALVHYLDAHVGPRDTIVFVSPEQAGYYQALSTEHRRWVLVPVGTDYLDGDIKARARTELAPLDSRTKTYWLVLYRQLLGPGAYKVVDWLSLNAFPAPIAKVPDSDIAPFFGGEDTPKPLRSIDVQFADGVTLRQVAYPSRVAAGGALPVQLIWHADGPLKRNLTVFVHFVDAKEKLWAQHDSPPINDRAPTTIWTNGETVNDRHGLIVPANAPSGQYWVEVGLYDAQGRLPLEEGGDTVRLGPITVTNHS